MFARGRELGVGLQWRGIRQPGNYFSAISINRLMKHPKLPYLFSEFSATRDALLF